MGNLDVMLLEYVHKGIGRFVFKQLYIKKIMQHNNNM